MTTPKTVVIVGPKACGKTRNSSKLLAMYGCPLLVDNWTNQVPLLRGALHLTYETPKQARLEEFPEGVLVVNFESLGLEAEPA